MKRVKVLWLIKGLGLGGAERMLVAAAPHLNRDEFEYEIGYFLPWKDALVEELSRHGLRVTCFGAGWPWGTRAVNRVRRYLKSRRLDVLHTHLPWASIVGRAAAKLANVPAVIYTEHGCWERLHPVTRALNRLTIGANDLTIAVSDAVAASMSGVNGHSVRTIPNGIDCLGLSQIVCRREEVLAELGVPDDHFIIVKVANLLPVKQHEMLLEAFARLLVQCPKSALVLVGQYRGRRNWLENYARKLGVAEKVVFTGPRTDAPHIVKSADVFAMSSRSEGLPVSLLEAMALSKPVVCTGVGGIPGVVSDGEEGFLVGSGDAATMADRLGRLQGDPELRLRIGAAGQCKVSRQYDIAVMVKEVEAEYRRVLGAKKSSAN